MTIDPFLLPIYARFLFLVGLVAVNMANHKQNYLTPNPSLIRRLGAASDLSALNACYRAWGGANSAALTGGWGGAGPVCSGLGPSNSSWRGVTCNKGAVVKVNVTAFGLSGSIPSQIGGLTALTYLSLDHNKLSDIIPLEMWGLTGLSHLDIHFNDLTGNIPSQIGGLTGLTYLRLDFNSITGSIPSQIDGLTGLTHLDLHFNSITGRIPFEMGGLAGLSFLDLRNNKLADSIPSQIGGLTGLTYLNLAMNCLSGSIPSQIGGLTGLSSLDLGFSSIAGSIPSQLGGLKGLSCLDLYKTDLSGSIPSQIGGLTGLTYLDFASNSFTGMVPDSFCGLKKHILLDIRDTKVSCYPRCLADLFTDFKRGLVFACTAAPTSFPTTNPTVYPTSTSTQVPAQWSFANFQVSQVFTCVGAVASCSSNALFQPILQAVNAQLWVMRADPLGQLAWLTEDMIFRGTAVSFNPITSAAGGYLVSYVVTYRPIDLAMSSIDAVRLSFQRATCSQKPCSAAELARYNAELKQILQLPAYSSNALGSLAALECTSIIVGEAIVSNGAPTAFPTGAPKVALVISAQIALGAAAAVALMLSAAIWFLRSGLQHTHGFGTGNDGATGGEELSKHGGQSGRGKNEVIVCFRPHEFVLSIFITVMAAASNIYQIKIFFGDSHPASGVGAVMMTSRILVALYSCALMYLTLKSASYSQLLAATLLHKSTLWVLVAAVALFDPTHLRFFPWRHSEFAERSR